MFPPCSLETVRVEVGEVLKMTGQSIEAFERVKVLDMIDPCPSAIIHQTEGSSHLQKRMLRQKKWHPKEHEPLPNNGFQAPLSSQLLTFTSSYLASKNMEDVSIGRNLKATVNPSCPGLPTVLKLSKAETAEHVFFLSKLWGWESKMTSCDPVGWCKVANVYWYSVRIVPFVFV